MACQRALQFPRTSSGEFCPTVNCSKHAWAAVTQWSCFPHSGHCWNWAGGGLVQPTSYCCFPQLFPPAPRHWWFRHADCPSYASETLQQVWRPQVTQHSPQRLSQSLSLSNSTDGVRQNDHSVSNISYATGLFLKGISCWVMKGLASFTE